MLNRLFKVKAKAAGAKSRNRKSSALLNSVVEPLEFRRLMSVSASTLFGPSDQGDVWNYQISNSTNVDGTIVITAEGAATFAGQSTQDRKSVSSSAVSGDVSTSHSYDAITSAGVVDYGSVSSTANASGGVLNSDMDVNTPPEVAIPAQLTAGVTYTSTYTDTDTETSLGVTNAPSSTTNTQTVVLTSETPTPITVVAGTYNAYELTLGGSTVNADGSTTPEGSTIEYFSPSVGLVEITSGSGDTSETVQLASFNGTTSSGGTGGSGGTVTNSGALTPLVLKTSLPTSVVAGGTTHGTATVNLGNTNTAKVDEAVTTQVYASLDGAVDSSSILLGTLSKSVRVNPGTAVPETVTIKSLPASLDGTYTLLAKITDPEGTSSSTTGPSLTAAAPFVAFTNESLITNLTGSVISGSKTKDTVSITLTNNGNIASSGSTTVSLLVSPDGTVASGTSIRTLPETIAIKPGKNKTVKIPLETLPNVANGTYQVVAQLTDSSGDITAVASTTTVSLAQAFITLTPALSTIVTSSKGTGTVLLTVTNNGNSIPVGSSTVVLYAAASDSINGATQLVSEKISLPVKPGKNKMLKFKLTAAQVSSIDSSGFLLAAVTDPTGAVLTATTLGAGQIN